MKKFIKLIFAASFVVSLASCLKDKDYDNNVLGHNLSSVPKIIEVGYINEPIHLKTVGLDFEDKAVQPIAFYVRLAGTEVASEDITVTLDTTGAYAKVTGAGYVLLPGSFYTHAVPSFNIVIAKGTRETAVSIKTNAINFDPSTTYGLYFKIKSVDKSGYNISGNYGDFMTLFGAKNKFDGTYKLQVRMRAPSNDRPTVNVSTSWPWGGPVMLETISGTTVALFDDWGFGDYIQPIQTAAGVYSGFGSTAPRFTFNNATNKMVAAVNAFPNPANGRAFQIDPAIDSYWDPGTKNIYAHFIMTQPGFQPLYIADTLLYLGPR
jgi:Domain of unknown function (DUF1735)